MRSVAAFLRALAPNVGLSPQEITRFGTDGYVRFLHATHAYIRTSVPLMVDARTRFTELNERHIVDYLAQHIVEETDHDRWTIEDLERHGLDTDTSAAEMIPEIAAATGAQYYHVRHGNPWLFFAYVYALETSPPSSVLIEHLRDETGLPDSAFRTLRAHQDLDTGHAADLADLIDTFSLPFRRTPCSALPRSTWVFAKLWRLPHEPRDLRRSHGRRLRLLV